jgi:hypothetical protein
MKDNDQHFVLDSDPEHVTSFIFFTTHHIFSPFLDTLESTTNDKVPWPNRIHSIHDTLVISLFIDEEISVMFKYMELLLQMMILVFKESSKNVDEISTLVTDMNCALIF